MSTPVSESAAARVAGGLRDAISSGQIAPGTALSQSVIATEYGVSRIPVRDALQMLATEGLVDLRGATAVVTSLSVGDLQELYDLRLAVEPMATRLAVPRVGRAETSRMAALIEVMEAATITPGEWVEANTDFHALVYRQCDRVRTVALVEQLRRLTDRYIYFHIDVVGEAEHLHEEHRQILDAVRAGDAVRAADVTRQHLASSHDFVLRYLMAQDDTGMADAVSSRRRP